MDVAVGGGGGGYFRGDWFYFIFAIDQPAWSQLHLYYKETLAIVLSAKCWAPLWANNRVVIHSDNQIAVHIRNKGSIPYLFIMHQPRELFSLPAIYNFHFSGV